jgi:SAM-dependent methyltransferase
MILDTQRLRRMFYELRTEWGGPRRDPAAFGVGTFIGCSPLYGFHLLLVWVVGRLLRLNRLKMYLAANISNPIVSPLLILSELQAGAWVRRQDFHDLSLSAIRHTNAWVYAGDLVLGSLVVGSILGVLVAAATYASTELAGRDDPFAVLWARASDPYLPLGITAWEFARGKLRHDPLYRATVAGGLVTDGRTLVDVGCGQGLTLGVLLHAPQLWSEGGWPAGARKPPQFDRLVGIEIRPRVARIAQTALGPAVEVLSGDAREAMPAGADSILFFDVLHLIPPADQERLIAEASRSLSPGGTILIREADPSGGWRFNAVRFGNRLKSIGAGRWRQRFHFRTVDAWAALLARNGMDVGVHPMNEGTPFANVLVRGVRSVHAPGLHDMADVHERQARYTGDRVEFTAEPEAARDR